MEPQYISISRLFNSDDNGSFKNKPISVPAFQRPYSWNKENWGMLWDDIIEQIDQKEYFLGSIVTISNEEGFEIIDGQQRITTLSIFFLVIRNLFKAVPFPDTETGNDSLGRIRSSLNEICFLNKKPRLCLSKQSKATKKGVLDRNDYNNLNETILNSETYYDYNINKSKEIDVYGKSLIASCYKFFEGKLFEHLNLELSDEIKKNKFIKFENEAYCKLVEIIDCLNKARVIHFSTADLNTAFKLFDCLNNRGVPLTISEILKNKFFEGIEAENKQSKFDEIEDQWKEFSEDWFSNDNKLQTRFLRYFLISEIKMGKDIGTGDPKKITSSKVIDYLLKHQKNNFENQWQEFFNYFVEEAKHFKNLDNIKYINQNFYNDNCLDTFKLAHTGYSSLRLLAYHYKRLGYDNDFLNKLSSYLWSFSLRAQILQVFENKYLDTAVFATMRKSYDTSLSPEHVFKEFLKNLNQSKLDKMKINEISEKLSSGSIYEVSDSLSRSILSVVELNQAKLREKINVFQEKDDRNEYAFSIEHILPQKPSKNSDWMKSFSDDERNKVKHLLGNLTLTKYNSQQSNSDFEKKKEYLSASDLILNRYFDNLNSWYKEDIIARNKHLIEKLIDILYLDFLDAEPQHSFNERKIA